MKKEVLYNKKSRDLLLKELEQEPFERITCSFYRYVKIKNPQKMRNILYKKWLKINNKPLTIVLS